MTMKKHPDDFIVWPDDYWCFRSELWEHGDRSDDYYVIPFGTTEWDEFWSQNEYP